MNRSTLVSGLLFAVLTPAAFHLIGWESDAWVALPLALLHLFLVQRASIRLSRGQVLFHYGILLFALLGLLVPLLLRLPGPASEEWRSMALQQSTNELGNPLWVLGFLVSALALFFILHGLGRSTRRDPGPWREGFRTGLFVFSVLLVPGSFVAEDIVARVGAERPSEAADFVIAAIVSSLALPLFFHGLAVLAVILMRDLPWQTED